MEKNKRIELVFASANPYKIKEIQSLVSNEWNLKGLSDIGITEDIAETGITLEENALIKAHYVHHLTGLNCFAEDTGLEVFALNMEPGVYSARYAGAQRSSEDNMNLLISKLEHHSNRLAQFRTVIALIYNGVEYLFEGVVKGDISVIRSGSSGFGYDPIFIPEGYKLTFAEISLEIKNQISHRGLAIQKMRSFLSPLNGD